MFLTRSYGSLQTFLCSEAVVSDPAGRGHQLQSGDKLRSDGKAGLTPQFEI